MTRKKRFFQGVASGYLAMGSNVVYSMSAVPLALHYFPKEEFGIWVLVSQIAGYLMLVDLGMGNASARILIDSKDNRNGGQYGSILSTSMLVFLVQATLVAICGAFLAPAASMLIELPQPHRGIFELLFLFQCVLLSLGCISRFFVAPLNAHQRYDIVNFAQASQLLLALAALWIGLACHLGLYSMIVAGLVSWIWGVLVTATATFRLRLLPSRGNWGRPNRAAFFELFSYGKDSFFIAVGWQMLSASQVVIVSRVLGIDAAAIWAVSTKLLTLSQQFVWRIFDFSCGAFSEMYVRGERKVLEKRFKQILEITASVSLFVGSLIAFCNTPFVHLWTHNRISWNPLNDVLLGILLVVYSVNRCHCGMPQITKSFGFLRYLNIFEGAFFIVVACLAIQTWGFSGIILSAIAADLLFQCAYGLYRSKELFGCTYGQMALWLKAPMLYAVCFLLPASILIPVLEKLGGSNALFLKSGFLFLVGLPTLWQIGLSPQIRAELSANLRRFLPQIF